MSRALLLLVLAQPIDEIRVAGNVLTSVDTIRHYASPVDRESLDASFQRLWDTGLFEDLRFELEDDLLVIHVVEKPRLASFRIEAEGVDGGDVERALGLRRGLPFGEVELHQARRALAESLGDAFEVQIEASPAAGGPLGQVDLVVAVEPAPAESIRELRFEGNVEIDDDELEAVIESRARSWTSWITRRDRLRADRVEADVERIRALYRARGDLDVRVGPVTPSSRLVIPIVEGRRYRMASIDVEPGSLLSLEQGRDLLPAAGNRYSQGAVDRSVAALERHYQDRGYPSVTVVRERSVTAPGEVAVRLRVQEGSFYRVGRIVFHGNARHRDRDLRQHLDLDESDRFHQTRLTRDVRAVAALATIADVVPEVDFLSEPGRAHVTYRVQEVDRFEYLVGGGLNGTQGGSANGQFIAKSLLGRGDVWSLNVDLGNRLQNFTAGYRDPSTLGKRLFLAVDFARADITFPDDTAEDSLDLSIRVGGPQGRRLQWLAGFRLARFTLDSTLEGDVPFLTEFLGQRFRTQRLSASVVFDSRDLVVFPSRGGAFQAAAELVEGDVQAFKLTARASRVLPFGERHALAFSGRAGAVFARGSTTDSGLPRFERLFLGSENDLRGFAIRGVGPRDGDVVVGGDRLVYGSAEYQLSLHPRLKVVGFFDLGNVYATDFDGVELPTLRYDVGPELRWLAPVWNLPVRAGYGLNLDRIEGEGRGRFFVTLSFRF